ncbi:hypothetical protein CPC16_003359, partial [Podila verticillata]
MTSLLRITKQAIEFNKSRATSDIYNNSSDLEADGDSNSDIEEDAMPEFKGETGSGSAHKVKLMALRQKSLE